MEKSNICGNQRGTPSFGDRSPRKFLPIRIRTARSTVLALELVGLMPHFVIDILSDFSAVSQFSGLEGSRRGPRVVCERSPRG